MTPTFYIWPKLTAFDDKTVGSKVTDRVRFLEVLSAAVADFDFNAETNEHVTTTGQGFIVIPTYKLPDNTILRVRMPALQPLQGQGVPLSYLVSAGVGLKVTEPESYVLREWRGNVKAFLKRNLAAPVESLAVVVYTVEAYLADPDVDPSERAEIEAGGATHAIVAVLANAGPKPPAYSPGRLVSNLAGGNKDALAWDADTIRKHARAASEYANEWDVVAD